MNKALRRLHAALMLVLLGIGAPLSAQVTTKIPAPVPGARPVAIERIKVHSPAVAGNLEGDSADRDVLVILPPSYAKSPRRHYPVLYALHGYSIGAEQWVREIHVPQTIEGAFAKGAAEMIVVIPDSRTVHNGSMYSSSVTTGDFESFVARDLVAYVDSHYRTIPARESRGLAGHSMGGYGTARIGLKHPDVFGALYMMSPCCLSPRDPRQFDAAAATALANVKSLEEATKLSWIERAQLASAAAWSPNPAKPPLFLDLPVENGEVQPQVLAKWAANAPLAFLDQYVFNLRRYRCIAIDVGDRDGLREDARKLHEAFDRYGIGNRFEIYPGDHTSDVAARFQDHVIPFFAAMLRFGPRG